MLTVLGWLSRRSLGFLHALGALLGWAGYGLSGSYRRRVRMHAALAGLGAADRRAAVAEAGRMVAEMPLLWLRPSGQPVQPRVLALPDRHGRHGAWGDGRGRLRPRGGQDSARAPADHPAGGREAGALARPAPALRYNLFE